MDSNMLSLFFEEDNITTNITNEIVQLLAQSSPVLEDVNRGIVPKNQNFYEVTIPQYMGDLFKDHFRMSRSAFEQLFHIIAGISEGSHKIPLEKKLLYTLWVISKQESFLAAGDRFGMGKSTAHNIFKEVINLITGLTQTFLIWPNNYARVAEGFYNKYQIPGVVGAIDGCHVEIRQPSNNSHDYYNRLNFHSIILQGICDANMKFLDVFIGVPGRVHDARAFRNSPIFNHIQQMPQNLHILADSAYALTKNVLTPFPNNGHLTSVETHFNVRHSAARSIIERTFGRLKGKFRRLKYLDIAKPETACDIILAACVLHNFIIIKDGDDDENFEPDARVIDYDSTEEIATYNHNIALQKRMEIANLLFSQ